MTSDSTGNPKQSIELVQFVFDHASPIGPHLRTLLMQRCIAQSRSEQGINSEIKRVVEQAEPVAWAVGIASAKEIERLQERQARTEAQLAEWQLGNRLNDDHLYD